MTDTTKPPIGFVGLGLMGSPMAARLLEAGYPVTVYNRSPEKARPLAERGARVAASPRELAAESEFVLTILSDDSAVECVVFGPDGILAGANPGTILIEMSTVYPHTPRVIYEAAISRGVMMVDAPVAGSTPQAEAGELVIFVGGDVEVYRQCLPVLHVLGREALYMGHSGAGSTMKLVVNALLGMGFQALAEGIALGLKAGLDRDRFFDALGKSAILSRGQQSRLENARSGQYPVHFPLRLMRKDFGLIFRKAKEVSVPMPMAAAAEQQFVAAYARGGGEEDASTVIRLMMEIARLDLKHDGTKRAKKDKRTEKGT